MTSTFGTTVKVSIFGESHAPKIGCKIGGLPAGFTVDLHELKTFLQRRSSSHPWDTPRKEIDDPKFISGISAKGTLDGSLLTAELPNNNIRPQDYSDTKIVPRPGHADFSAWAKWGDSYKQTGGGHFSARLTAPLCIAGGIALQILHAQGITIAAHVLKIKDVNDTPFELVDNSVEANKLLVLQMNQLLQTAPQELPFLDAQAGEKTRALLTQLRSEKNTVGGIIECVATGVPAGIGCPHFHGLENTISAAVFGVPAVKAIEFGSGMNVANLLGSENNDAYEVRNGAVVPTTNHAGGILGGISTGAPIWFRCALKPISSIGLPQNSVNLQTMKSEQLVVQGRHDITAVLRAVPCIESAFALALLDTLYSWPSEQNGHDNDK